MRSEVRNLWRKQADRDAALIALLQELMERGADFGKLFKLIRRSGYALKPQAGLARVLGPEAEPAAQGQAPFAATVAPQAPDFGRGPNVGWSADFMSDALWD